MRRVILTGVILMTLPGVSAAVSEAGAEATIGSGNEARTIGSAAVARPDASAVANPATAAATTGSTAVGAGSAAGPTRVETDPAMPPVPADAVARSTFATDIDEREPVDRIDSLGNDHDVVFYFTEFVGLEGRELTHRWEFDGEVMAEVPISIHGPRWRAYSSKNLAGGMLGEWKVSVVDESGRVVQTDRFVYEKAAPPEPEIAGSEPAPAASVAIEPEMGADEERAGPAAPVHR